MLTINTLLKIIQEQGVLGGEANLSAKNANAAKEVQKLFGARLIDPSGSGQANREGMEMGTNSQFRPHPKTGISRKSVRRLALLQGHTKWEWVSTPIARSANWVLRTIGAIRHVLHKRACNCKGIVDCQNS